MAELGFGSSSSCSAERSLSWAAAWSGRGVADFDLLGCTRLTSFAVAASGVAWLGFRARAKRSERLSCPSSAS